MWFSTVLVVAKMKFIKIKSEVERVLSRAKSMHPSQLTRNEEIIKRLASIVNSMLSENYEEIEIGEILQMIKSTNVDLFNRVIDLTKNPVKCRQIHSRYSWNIKLKKIRSK